MRIAYNPKSKAAISSLPSDYLNDLVFDLPGLAIYAKGVKFKGTDTTYNVFKKHTTSNNTGGENGLVPVPSYTTTKTRFLREDSTWALPLQRIIKVDGTTVLESSDYDKALDLIAGNQIRLTNIDGKVTIDTVFEIDGNFTGEIKNAFTDVKVGSTTLSADTTRTLNISSGTGIVITPNRANNNISIEAPIFEGAKSSAAGKEGIVPAPSTSNITSYLRGNGSWSNITTDHIVGLDQYAISTTTTQSELVLKTTDSLNSALGKLENKANLGMSAYNWVTSVTDEDTDGYINKWQEIVDFLNEVKNADGDILDQFVTISTAQTVKGAKTFTAAMTLQSTLSITGATTMDNNLTIKGNITPNGNNTYNLGSSAAKWKAVYASTFVGSLNGNADTATTASKLGTSDLGSNVLGIYLEGGVAKKMAYSLSATVNEATQWGIAYYSTKNNITSTSAGNSGQLLKSNGTSAPTWVNQNSLDPGVSLSSTKDTNLTVGVGASSQTLTNLYATYDNTGRNIVNTYVDLSNAQTISGVKTFSSQQKFTATTTSPFTVSSTTKVSNLNADFLDGYHADELFEELKNDNNQIYIKIGNNSKSLTVAYATAASTMPYTGLTGSTTTKDQVIISNGTANGWTLKTLGSRAFDSTAYLPLAGGTLTGPLTAQNITPSTNNAYSLGTSSAKWKEVYATNFYGNASTASAWATARTIKITGAVTGQLAGVDGSGDITISTAVNHTHNYTSKISVNGQEYSVSSNKITIPDYPDEILTIKLNGTKALEYDGYESKEININWSNVGAAELGHTHKYAGSDSVGGVANSAKQANNADTVDNYHIAVQSSVGSDPNTIYFII